jgi:hypothetical protein
LIYSSKVIEREAATCCNVSSWYVDPAFRNYAALFASMTQKRKDITYLNVTPAVATWPILEAQGFVPYLPRPPFLSSDLVAKLARHDGRNRYAGHGLHRGLAGCGPCDAQAPCRIWLPQPGVPHGRSRPSLHFFLTAKTPWNSSPARHAARLLPHEDRSLETHSRIEPSTIRS